MAFEEYVQFRVTSGQKRKLRTIGERQERGFSEWLRRVIDQADPEEIAPPRDRAGSERVPA